MQEIRLKDICFASHRLFSGGWTFSAHVIIEFGNSTRASRRLTLCVPTPARAVSAAAPTTFQKLSVNFANH